ncbi:hypothetical protein GOP47_0023168 [Adiantum capillus-veneris]|uniref:Uncharacterized protein n=1 Tax=Adiantum capillus-veneris TaxID=13818 RepID=A0A9D4U6T9_ADICA|nr:hypothetical protein GOP47_0023168 [Adiantum capillus-veneris]
MAEAGGSDRRRRRQYSNLSHCFPLEDRRSPNHRHGSHSYSNRNNRLQSSADNVSDLRGVVSLPGEGTRRTMFEARVNFPAQSRDSVSGVIRLGRYSRAEAAGIAHDVFQVFMHHDTTVNFPELLHIYRMRTPRRMIDHHGAQVPVTREDVVHNQEIARRINETQFPSAAFQRSETRYIPIPEDALTTNLRPASGCSASVAFASDEADPSGHDDDSFQPRNRLFPDVLREYRRQQREYEEPSRDPAEANVRESSTLVDLALYEYGNSQRQMPQIRYEGSSSSNVRDPSTLVDLALYDQSARNSQIRQMPQSYAPGPGPAAIRLNIRSKTPQQSMQLANQPHAEDVQLQQGYDHDQYYGDGGHYNNYQDTVQLQRPHPREPLELAANDRPFVRQRSPTANAIDSTRYPPLFFDLNRAPLPRPSTCDDSRAALDPNRAQGTH